MGIFVLLNLFSLRGPRWLWVANGRQHTWSCMLPESRFVQQCPESSPWLILLIEEFICFSRCTEPNNKWLGCKLLKRNASSSSRIAEWQFFISSFSLLTCAGFLGTTDLTKVISPAWKDRLNNWHCNTLKVMIICVFLLQLFILSLSPPLSVCSLYVCTWTYMHKTCVEIRGQLGESILPFHHVWPKDQSQSCMWH